MYSGSDSNESQKFPQWALNPATYQNMANDQVDWAALAQQWIIMKEAGPPPVPGEHPIVLGPPTKKEVKHEGGESGEAPMEVENDKVENQLWTDITGPPPRASGSGDSWNWNTPNQSWGWNNTWAPPPVPPLTSAAPKPPLLPTPGNFNQYNAPADSANDNATFGGYATSANNEYQAGYWTSNKHIKPHNRRYSKVNAPRPVPPAPPIISESSPPSTLDAVKRKQLPAWIREGLEKMERDKLKQIEREREKQERDDYNEKVKESEKVKMEILKNTMKEQQKSKFLQEDMENYVRYKLMGGKIIMKRDVVPHFFECQRDRKRTASNVPARSLPMKRERKRLVAEAEAADEQCFADQSLDTPSTSMAHMHEQVQQESDSTLYEQKSIGIQVRPSFRSKYVECNLTVPVHNVAVSPVHALYRDTATSPLKVGGAKKSLFQTSTISSSSENDDKSQSSLFTPSTSTSSSDMNMDDKQEQKTRAINVTYSVTELNSKFYLGVPNIWLPHLMKLLSDKTNLQKGNIYLTLMKIKLNDSFQRLGHMFGMSTGNAARIFAKTLIQIEPYLSTLIFWPPSERIKYFLPIPFRARYHNVQSIIDCLQIEIEKPTDPVKQALTWSEYKKCNTLKYLVSSTPDGFINYISIGYGGRVSDTLLLKTCGYLLEVPAESSVMADRGFKDVAKYLHERKCHLVRPPSVSSSTKPTRAEVMESKRIASLRIHIERVIRRIREFQYLKPHSVINHNLIVHTDSVIRIACALINLQNPIIKQE